MEVEWRKLCNCKGAAPASRNVDCNSSFQDSPRIFTSIKQGKEESCTITMEKGSTLSQKRAVSSTNKLSTSSAPATRKPVQVKSFTRDEIDRYWRVRRMIEADHLLFAEKAAARVRAKALKEEDHRRFEEMLKEMLVLEERERKKGEKTGGVNKELAAGIKDWWTKSKYAYLNQPAIKSMGENTKSKPENSTHIPQKTCFYRSHSMERIYSTQFGVY